MYTWVYAPAQNPSMDYLPGVNSLTELPNGLSEAVAISATVPNEPHEVKLKNSIE